MLGLPPTAHGVPFLKVKQSVSEKKGSSATPDMIVEIEGPQGKQLVLLEVKTNGEPRFAREAVNQLLRFRQSYPDAYGVFAAPYITPRAAEICNSEGIGYVDLSGNCRLCFGTTFIQQEGRPNKFAEKRDLRTLYSPKATRILRVLLNEPKRVWKITELSQEAEVSLGLVSNVKRLLENREWIGLSRSGFSLSQPEELLAEWKDNYNFHGNELRDYYSLKKPTQIEADLASICSSQRIRYALTSFSAAVRLAPFVPYQRVFAFIAFSLRQRCFLRNSGVRRDSNGISDSGVPGPDRISRSRGRGSKYDTARGRQARMVSRRDYAQEAVEAVPIWLSMAQCQYRYTVACRMGRKIR